MKKTGLIFLLYLSFVLGGCITPSRGAMRPNLVLMEDQTSASENISRETEHRQPRAQAVNRLLIGLVAILVVLNLFFLFRGRQR